MQKQGSKKQSTQSKKPEPKLTLKTIEDKQYSKSLKGLLRALKNNKKEKAKEILESLTEKEQDEIFKYIENNWDKEDLAREKKEIIDATLSLVFEINKERLQENPKGEYAVNKLLLSAGSHVFNGISLFLKALFNGADINATGLDNLRVLHEAAISGNLTLIKFIAKNKYLRDSIYWNARTRGIWARGWTFLHFAFHNHKLHIINFIARSKDLKDKIDWYVRDYNGVIFLGAASPSYTIDYDPDYVINFISSLAREQNYDKFWSNIVREFSFDLAKDCDAFLLEIIKKL